MYYSYKEYIGRTSFKKKKKELIHSRIYDTVCYLYAMFVVLFYMGRSLSLKSENM